MPDSAHAYGIVALPFNFPSSAFSNRLLSLMADEESTRLNAPIYAHPDLAVAADPALVTRTPRIPGQAISTLVFARGAIAWARERQLNVLVAVAATPHIPRLLRDLNEAQKEAGLNMAIFRSSKMDIDPTFDWFNPEGRPWLTFPKWAWKLRDFILKRMPYARYKDLKPNWKN